MALPCHVPPEKVPPVKAPESVAPKILGLVSTLDEARTKPPPVPTSSVRIPANSAEVVKAEERPRVEVASQSVPAPVEVRIIPAVPEALPESRKAPVA